MRRCFLSFCMLLGLAACAVGPSGPAHTPAEQTGIDRAQAALDGMGGLSARFLQVAPDGQTADGKAWFETGHLRLQYDAPVRRLAVASGGRLVIHDQATDSTTRIALASNPLGLLLSGPVRLSGEIEVTDIHDGPSLLQLSLARSSNPAQGLLTLYFADDRHGRLLLSGLEAVDSQGRRTRFHLTDVRIGQHLDPALFSQSAV